MNNKPTGKCFECGKRSGEFFYCSEACGDKARAREAEIASLNYVSGVSCKCGTTGCDGCKCNELASKIAKLREENNKLYDALNDIRMPSDGDTRKPCCIAAKALNYAHQHPEDQDEIKKPAPIVLNDGIAYTDRNNHLAPATLGECAFEIARLRRVIERFHNAMRDSEKEMVELFFRE